MAAPDENRAKAYGIASLVLAIANVGMMAGLLLKLSSLDEPIAFAEDPRLATVSSAVVAAALVVAIVMLVLAINSLHICWKHRSRRPATATVAFCIGTIFLAAFVSLGSLTATDQMIAKRGREAVPTGNLGEAILLQWRDISCGLIQEVLEFAHGIDRGRRSTETSALLALVSARTRGTPMVGGASLHGRCIPGGANALRDS